MDEIIEGDITLPEVVSKEEVRLEKDFDSEQKEGDSSSPFLEVNSELTANLSTGDENEKVESEIANKNQSSNHSFANGSTEYLNEAFVSHDLEQTRVTSEIKLDNNQIDLQSDTEEETNKLCEEDKEKELRKSVDDFYESILSEDSSQENTGDGLPPGATFGQPIGLSASYDHEDGSDPALSPNENKKRKEGWLVRVESFSTPASCTPQIKVIGDDDQVEGCLLYTSPSPRDGLLSRMPSSA